MIGNTRINVAAALTASIVSVTGCDQDTARPPAPAPAPAPTPAATPAPATPSPTAPPSAAAASPGTSTDPEYGFSKAKPICVGSKDEFAGPSVERAYLNLLRDEAGKPITFERVGSFGAGADGHILDGYEIRTSTGKSFTLYIDMYHPENSPESQPAPVGFSKSK